MTENNNMLMNWTDELLKERLELTRVWKTLDNGFIIQELRPERIDEVVEVIKEYYVVDEPSMFGSQMYKDNESVEQYLYLVRHWMMDTQSTVVVEQETGNVIGFLICRYNELSNKDPELSREKVYEGNTWTKLHKFKHYLTKKRNAYEYYNVDNVLEVYSWFVLPDYRRKGIGSELLKNVLQRQLIEYKIDVVAGLFTSKTSQQIAEFLGMETLYTFVYAEWTVDNEETRVAETFFWQLKPDEHSVKIMSTRIRTEDKLQQTTIANA